jgi:hypothetical protein
MQTTTRTPRLTTLPLANPKTAKGLAYGWSTLILHLHPGRAVCPGASKGCLMGCLNTSGHGGIFKPGERSNSVLDARKRRTRTLGTDRAGFLAQADREVRSFVKRCRARVELPALRMNGTSDLDWQAILGDLGRSWDALGVRRYDYTKLAARVRAPRPGWDLTFSRSEENDAECLALLAEGYRVAVVADRSTREELLALGAIDGDAHDLRFLEPGGVVVLSAKGRAKNDVSGFVLRSVPGYIISWLSGAR